jgi:plastocyanin
VFSYATKVLIALTGSAFIAAGVFYGVVGERSGAVLMVFVGIAALLALLTVTGSGVVDIAPDVPADAGAPDPQATTPGQPGRASVWPVLAAAAVAVLAVGLAVGPAMVYAGIIAVAVAALGWFGKSWTEHATWTPRVSSRVSDRFIAPLGFPVLGFLLAAVIAISLSRVLLAIPEKVAPWIALGVAIVVLMGCFWLASRPRIRSSAITLLAALAGVSMLGAGIAGATQGERKFEAHEHDEAVEVEAKDVNFTTKELVAPDEEQIRLKFVNEDDEVYHNVAIYDSEAAEAKPIFNGEGFPGPDSRTYVFKSPGAGRYTFRCDFHANMVGTFVVGGS